jgi:endonuclease YncB( thermonuclease family)
MTKTQPMLTQSRHTAIGFAARAAAVLIALLLSFQTNAQTPLTGTASVIDGDTIEVHASGSDCTALMPPRAAKNVGVRIAPLGAVASRPRWHCPITSAAKSSAASRLTEIGMAESSRPARSRAVT